MRGGRFEQNVSGSKAAMAGRRSAADCHEYRSDRPENGDPNGDPIRYQNRSQRVTGHPNGRAVSEVTNRQAQRWISAFGGPKKWWTGGELNSRHRDFQSRAFARRGADFRTRGPKLGPNGLT
jgi:hypothetical protein